MATASPLLLLFLLGLLLVEADSSYYPDAHLLTPDLIRKNGYPSESHTIETEDGYLLTLHRIPHGKHKPQNKTLLPIFLQHGLLSSSADWLINGPNKSLAYILADLGYDVWMGNARGNTYSRSHVSLSLDNPQYWNFSFHEMGLYDLPASLDWVLNVTGRDKLFYVGHSMGTTMFFVMASSLPQYNDKIQLMVSLAPVAFMEHIKSPIRLLVPFTRDLQFISRYLGEGEFLPHNKILDWLGKFGCELVTTEEKICEDTIFVLAGFDESQFNMTLLPVILGHAPAGSSTKTVIHYAQEIKSGKFQPYNEEGISNLEEYDLSQITVPVDIFYADNDWLAAPVDVKRLAEKLNKTVGYNRIPFDTFNHVDFVWGKDASSLVYEKVLQDLTKHEPVSKPSDIEEYVKTLA